MSLYESKSFHNPSKIKGCYHTRRKITNPFYTDDSKTIPEYPGLFDSAAGSLTSGRARRQRLAGGAAWQPWALPEPSHRAAGSGTKGPKASCRCPPRTPQSTRHPGTPPAKRARRPAPAAPPHLGAAVLAADGKSGSDALLPRRGGDWLGRVAPDDVRPRRRRWLRSGQAWGSP